MTNKRVVQTFLATSALFLAMSGMSARAQDTTAPAAAAPSATAPMHHHGGGFKKLDTNGDGMVSRDEAKGHRWLEEHFDEIDANHDGKVTEDEIRAFMKARHEARRAQRDTPAAAAMPGGPSATKGQ